jgi:hypothetical protein
MRKLFRFVLLLSLGLAFYPSRQVAFSQASGQSARKIAEYSKCRQTGVSDCINMEEEWVWIDSLAAELRNDLDSQAYIIDYKALHDLPGNSLHHINYVRNLVRSRVVDDSRVHVIDGGYRENLTIELWIAPSCASVPTPNQTVSIQAPNGRTAYKFEEITPPLKREIPIEFIEDELVFFSESALIDGFAALLEKEPTTRGYIIAYDGERDRTGTAYKFAESYRAYLYNSSLIGNPPNVITSEPSQVVSLKGGRRKVRTIELWIVPPGASQPKLTSAINR